MYKCAHLGYLSFADPERAQEKQQVWHDNCTLLINKLYESAQECSGPDMIREGVRFISGVYFGGKVLSKVCNMLKKAPSKIGQRVAEVVRVLQEENTVAVTPEGVPIRNANFMDKAKNVGDKVTKITTELAEWTSHGFKHFPPKNISWKKIIKATQYSDALYKPGVDIKKLELHAWKYGEKTTNGKNWKVFKSDVIIGAKNGKVTQYIRVECSANTIHGHPIFKNEYLRYLK